MQLLLERGWFEGGPTIQEHEDQNKQIWKLFIHSFYSVVQVTIISSRPRVGLLNEIRKSIEHHHPPPPTNYTP